MKHLYSLSLLILVFFFSASGVSAATYYMSPSGNDTNTGMTESSPVRSFDKANSLLNPGDTLILLDGEYKDSLRPKASKDLSKPITYKAKNDGKAIINGEHTRVPILAIGYTTPKTIFNNVFEGLVLINGDEYLYGTGGNVYTDNASHLTFRRVSSYNANVHINSIPFYIYNSEDVLIEDCIAAGTGRKAITFPRNKRVTIRRCFTDWHQWNGEGYHNPWPWGEGIDLYNTSDSIIENSISYGRVARYGITIRSNDDQFPSNNNKVLGSISVYSSMDKSNSNHEVLASPMEWSLSTKPPLKTQYLDFVKEDTSPEYLDYDLDNRVGIMIFGAADAQLNNNIIQDVLAYGNASVGLALSTGSWNAKPTNTTVNRVTLYSNTRQPIPNKSTQGTDIYQGDYAELTSSTVNNKITDSYIASVEGGTSNNSSTRGAGAKYNLLNRHYENGVLKEGTFWNGPNGTFPMEERARVEYERYLKHEYAFDGPDDFTPEGQAIVGFSITDAIKPIIQNAPTGNEDPPPLPTTGPSPTPTITPTKAPTPTPDPNAPISISAPVSYKAGTLAVGAPVYIDRSFTYTSIPSYLLGHPYIQTANDDKQQTGDSFLRFTVSKPSRVYVGMDTRVTPVPTWLASFTQSSDTIAYEAASSFALYFKDVPAGEVILGANSGQSANTSMYVVAVVPNDVATKPGDTDGDGDVDIFDYSTVISHFGQAVSGRSNGDLDGDNDVDIFDYNAVISNFGK